MSDSYEFATHTLSDSLWSWTIVRRTEFRALGGGRVYNGAIRDRQNENPGSYG